ncbi:DNA-directed RNA polymerase subunit beta [bacterium]|nr:DNA-directed RNA polymerase subunit beta [bacterium]
MKNKNSIQRINFSNTQTILDMPDLLEVQVLSFENFLQADVPPDKRERKGLQAVFLNIFPILDNREEHVVEFVEYYIAPPKYSIAECRERGVTFSAPLKAKLRLSSRDDYSEEVDYGQTIESDVYLGNLPLMTPEGTFIINGAERVIVSQLHRSPGAFFGESIHPNGTRLFSARVIPFRGSWIEFTTDINDVLYVYIDRRKRFPVTTLLRSIGFSRDWDIWDLFGYTEEVALGSKTIKNHFDREILREEIDKETGEVFVKTGDVFDADILKSMRKAGLKRVLFKKKSDTDIAHSIISNTMHKDRSSDEDEALVQLYRELRNGDPPDIETARKLLNRMFFDEKRYDLGLVGRYRINNKLNLDIPQDKTLLTKEDIVAIIKYVIDLRQGKETTDDIDHLGNRRIRTVGEQLANQFSIALSRMARTVKERMNIRDTENLTPQDLVNVRTVSSVINTFFGTNQLSQFMDQVNPLAELTHKRRLSALGPGGLTRERAGFEVRDVHYTHYGRLCPIETPEGPNIGLISSLCTYARINPLGFVETPYRKVRNKRVTKQIHYLTADDEDKVVIAQANAPLNEKGEFIRDRVKARSRSDYPVVTPDQTDYMDVSPNQIVSVAAALIPFLEHDDANRALMGSNMQRQAVPLLVPQAPLVGTGMESKAARDSRTLLIADQDMDIISVSADEIVAQVRLYDPRIKDDSAPIDTKKFKLRKFFRTNQDTCVNQKPIVEAGEHIRKGEVLADGCATEKGDLALGRNILVAFMPWNGYNFEDSIIISERLVSNDTFTSIHIEEVELQVRETKRGQEELTREIPNVSEEATRNLDENGIVCVGAQVREGDILIGKVTPKGETELTHEDKLLKAIFGDKAGDVKNASKTARPGMLGTVINSQLFSRKQKDPESRKEDKRRIERLDREFEEICHGIEEETRSELTNTLTGKTSNRITDRSGEMVLIPEGTKYDAEIIASIPLIELPSEVEWCKNKDSNKVADFLLERYLGKIYREDTQYRNARHKIQVGDELPSGIVQLAKVFIAQKRKIAVGDKMAGRHGNKGVVGKIVPIEDMPFLEDGTPIDMILNPLGVPSRMNLGQLLETALGWVAAELGVHFATPVFDGAETEDVVEYMKKAALPKDSKTRLYDGRAGEPFDQDVTVGVIYMMKLSHLVEDKIHARSIGPYSLITQQPLGGKAQFGGQRFGEMEVWALEAYGASHILQEILTVKSDDVSGRSRSYEAIVKGDIMPVPGVPESFNVLINELMGLGLEITLE